MKNCKQANYEHDDGDRPPLAHERGQFTNTQTHLLLAEYPPCQEVPRLLLLEVVAVEEKHHNLRAAHTACMRPGQKHLHADAKG